MSFTCLLPYYICSTVFWVSHGAIGVQIMNTTRLLCKDSFAFLPSMSFACSTLGNSRKDVVSIYAAIRCKPHYVSSRTELIHLATLRHEFAAFDDRIYLPSSTRFGLRHYKSRSKENSSSLSFEGKVIPQLPNERKLITRVN
jgi:hypothetical protein